MRRVKANDKISFPAALDMSPLLAGEGEQTQAGPAPQAQHFELAAILVHKGGSALQGHYGEPATCGALARQSGVLALWAGKHAASPASRLALGGALPPATASPRQPPRPWCVLAVPAR